jgi:hypothetical protein
MKRIPPHPRLIRDAGPAPDIGGAVKTIVLLFVTAIVILNANGCATARRGSDVGGVCRTALAGRDLGRLVVLARMSRDAEIPRAAEKEGLAAQAAVMALTASGSATSVPSETLTARLAMPWPDAGETELLAAARAAGIDTVAVLTVTEYVGRLHLGLPALWGTDTVYRYELRVLDAATGGLLLDARRYGMRGGPFRIRGLDDLNADFQKDLTDLIQAGPAS